MSLYPMTLRTYSMRTRNDLKLLPLQLHSWYNLMQAVQDVHLWEGWAVSLATK